jgi:hypothetical protein
MRLLQVSVAFDKIIHGENDPTTKIPCKHFPFKRYLIFQNFELLSIGTSGWIKALYIEATENEPLLERFQRNTSDPYVN